MLTMMVRNFSKIYYTLSYTHRKHETKFRLALLESLGTVTGNLGYKTAVTDMLITFHYSIKKPRMLEFYTFPPLASRFFNGVSFQQFNSLLIFSS